MKIYTLLLFVKTLILPVAADEMNRIYMKDENLAREERYSLVPSFLMPKIVKLHKPKLNVTYIAQKYTSGYVNQLCLMLTKSASKAASERQCVYFKEGAGDALLAEKASTMSRLDSFGFVKCSLVGDRHNQITIRVGTKLELVHLYLNKKEKVELNKVRDYDSKIRVLEWKVG